MVANSILNLSVFTDISVFHFVLRSFGGWTDRQTDRQAEADRQTKRLRIRISPLTLLSTNTAYQVGGLVSPIESVGFYQRGSNSSSLHGLE